MFAQLERETIQKRVTDAYYSRCQKGYRVGGKIPYGYNTEPIVMDGITTKMLIADPEASKLSEKCRLAEIAARMKIGGQENIIEEQFERLRSAHEESFHCNADRHLDDLYSPVLQKASEVVESEKIISKALVWFGSASDEFGNIEQRKTDLYQRIGLDGNVELVDKMSETFYRPQEILYLPSEDSDEQRVFVMVEENGDTYLSDEPSAEA